MAKPSTSLVVPLEKLTVAHVQNSHVGSLDAIGSRARQEYERIHRDAAMIPLRAVFLGCILGQVRAGCDHGEWGKWLAKHFGKAKSTAYRYLALAEACVVEKKLKLPELIALPQLSIDLEPAKKADDSDKALRKIKAFVGDRSLAQLLDEYAAPQPKLGGARKSTQKAGEIDPDTIAALKRDESAELIERARRLFVQENILQFLKPDEIRGVVESLEALATDVKAAARTILKKG